MGLLSALWTEDKHSNKGEESTPAVAPITPAPIHTPTHTFSTIDAVANPTTIVDDSKFVGIIEDSLKTEADKNKSFDFYRYLTALSHIAIPDEQAKYVTVFETAKVMNVTIEDLEKSADHYLAIVDNEQKSFDADLQVKTAQEITSRGNRLEQIKSTRDGLQAQIAKLNASVNDLNSEEITVSSELSGKTIELENAKASFASARQKIADGLLKIKTNLRQYVV